MRAERPNDNLPAFLSTDFNFGNKRYFLAMVYRYPDSVLMVFCKAPVPGQVKTRLQPELTAREAAAVHAELSDRTLKLAVQSRLCPVQLWCTPSPGHPFFQSCAQSYRIPLFRQQGADLGEKMQQAFRSALNVYAGAVIIGCDCPSLTENDLDQALSALAGPDVCVLGPAEDGGYVLIGLNRAHCQLFDGITWGTDLVFEQTHARIKQLHIDYFELSRQWDVDTPADLARYRSLQNRLTGN